MASYQIKDGAGAPQYIDTGSGDGSSGTPFTGKVAHLGDGTNQFKSGSAANLAGLSGVNAQLVAPPGQWVVTHAPAANNAASASKAAGAAGVRHVCTGVAFTLSQSTTGGTPFTGTVNLRDGATGAGTILATFYIGCPTAACSHSSFSWSGLNIPGTAATAMTLEFTAAGGAQTLESCTLTGYDAS